MGNTESQSSFVPPPKSSSFRVSSRRDEVPSARSWWKSNRSRGRSYVNQPASWTYDPAPNLRVSSPLPVQFGGGLNGTALQNGGGSPKVLLSKDGSMRVEFTNSRVTVETQGLTTSSGTVAPVPDPSLRTSKGSSLSSDGSWYDSPWGNGGDLSNNVVLCGQSVDNSNGFTSYCSSYNSFFSTKVDDISPGGFSTCCSGRTEDSGIGDSVILQPEPDFSLAPPAIDVYTNRSSPPAFPTSPELLQQRTNSTSSSSALLDDVIHEEAGLGGGNQRYSSCTLLSHRAESTTSSRKDFLKSRIRRLSDWTGSLSRKKRRIQDPISGDTSGGGFNDKLDTFWSCNPLHNQNQLAPVYFSSSKSLNQNQSSDVQRQNIYENFMQELQPRHSSTEELSDASEGEEDEEEFEKEDEDMEEEQGQQMEALFEKDQGVVRRAGWLSFKALLTLNKDGKLELVARRKWRHYWVTLKGCTLLFYQTYGRSGGADVELSPHYALQADDGIVQAVPEHPKKEHVFCLSNAHGDVYLFQATNQTDLENWVTSIHSASASRVAKRQGKDDTVRLLRSQSRSLLHNIDMDTKMKKMAELQLSVIKEHKNRRAVESQIQQWEQNLEKLNLDLFRTRCYLSSLQGGELPNPKGLLAVASRPSKSMLGRLGVFSVSSFHALVCSRDEATLRRRCQSSSRGHVKRRGQPSSLEVLIGQNGHCRDDSPSVPQMPGGGSWCNEAAPPGGPPAHAQVHHQQNTSVFTLHVCRPEAGADFGFAVTGHVDGSGQTHVFISEVDPRGPSAREGLGAGDEVLAVNGASVSGLDLDLMQSLFSHHRLELLLRRDGSRDPADPCPPPTPLWTTDPSSCPSCPPVFDDVCPQDTDQMDSLYQTFPECRAADLEVPKNPYSREAGLQPVSSSHLSACQHLRKVIEELVDTEKSYVKDLVRLFDLYLTPLQQETFLSKDEMEALFGSLPEMLDFQRVFLQTLEERIASCPNLSSLDTLEQFKGLLFSLGGSFLYYADHFKLYSGFCANHIKVQKVLERAKTDGAFKHFLEARNPTNQHSASLESYLIKPVQRVLKYPLLLRELVSLTDSESQEHAHLTDALRAMEKVATHINEMQKIYEDYGCVFDQLSAEVGGVHRQVTEISMGEFLVHSTVVWLNPLPSLGRLRKEPELTLFVFKRAVILIYRENKLKKRMTASRSADLDPFRFRWLIPVSAVQVRPADITGAENPCLWELVHSRSESEGRPETVFQLCSSGLDSKAVVLRALRSVLRDHAPSASLRRSRPSTAERRRRQQRRRHDAHGTPCHHGNSSRPASETCSEPPLPSHAPSAKVGEGGRSRLCSLTGDLEAQLQRLKFSPEEEEEEEEERKRRSLLELRGLLERDFSVHSMASIVNEDCFYDNIIKHNPVPALQGLG